MLNTLSAIVMATIIFLIMSIHTLIIFIPFLILGPLKFVIPIPAWRDWCSRTLHSVAINWALRNQAMFELLSLSQWHINGIEKIRSDRNYLMIANHQTGVDILAIWAATNGRTPMWHFFLKTSLFWVPVIGFACWAMDFPFMKRYSKKYLAKYPEKRGEDLRTTRVACERYRGKPVSVVNLAEGTRFSAEKHTQQNSPYQHLLRPKAGGVGLVLGAMGDHLDEVLDITITYPDGKGFWQFLGGRVPRIIVDLEPRPIPADFIGKDYVNDEEFRTAVQGWINQLWREKDELMAQRLSEAKARATISIGN